MNDWKQQQIKQIMEYFGIEEPSEIRTSQTTTSNGRAFDKVYREGVGCTPERCGCNG